MQFGLESNLQTGCEPRVSAGAGGTLVFDRKQGLLRQLEAEGKSHVNTENVNRGFSTALHIRLLEGSELAAVLNPPPPPPVATSVSTRLKHADLLPLTTDLESPDAGTRHNAPNRLNGGEPEVISVEFLETVTALLSDADSGIRQSATGFIANYETMNRVPILINRFQDHVPSVRLAAIGGLGRIKDARACEPLADLVARSQAET